MISYFNKINYPIYPQSPAQDMAVHSTERMVSMDGVPSILPTLGARQECKDSKLCSMDFHLVSVGLLRSKAEEISDPSLSTPGTAHTLGQGFSQLL